MDEDKYFEAKNRALAEFRHSISAGTDLVDPNLMMESLPTTLEQYQEQIQGSKTESSHRHVRSLFDNYGDNLCVETDDNEDAIIRTFVRRRDNMKPFTYNNNSRSQYSPNNRNDRRNRYTRNDRTPTVIQLTNSVKPVEDGAVQKGYVSP